MADSSLRQLPSVERLLGHPLTSSLIESYGRTLTIEALRAALDDARARLRSGSESSLDNAWLIHRARAKMDSWLAPTLRRAINATGVIVHTNLGRAPLADSAIQAVREVAVGYSTLEFDLESGGRGTRSVHAEALLKHITGAEGALVVNNNAAAVLLSLAALAGPTRDYPQGRGVLISRSQLVEIGGGFRMPDVMAQSGARMIEVGTTNRTHLHDYATPIEPNTALILRVHRSNFALLGFTTEPSLADLVGLAREHDLMVVDDLGSGALIDTTQFGLAPEPTAQASLAAGADLVMFSGDKLLGGPQAGILVGRGAVIEQLEHHPLMRALRPDKLCLAALAATLVHYLKGDALEQIPVWRMIGLPLPEVEARARRWADMLSAAGLPGEVIPGHSAIGGGSLPGEMLPTFLLAIRVPSPDEAASRLRAGDPPVIVRIEDDCLIVDPRTVLDRDEDDLLVALRSIKQAVHHS